MRSLEGNRASLREERRAGCHTVYRVLTPAFVLVATVALVDCQLVVPPPGWDESWGPLVPHESFPGDCGLCHVPERWDLLREEFSFDHAAETGHALEGAHSRAACLRCHNDRGPVRFFASRGCGGCHADPHRSSLGLDCTRCHGQRSWKPEGIIADHQRTRFPLFGAHLSAPCEGCHERALAGDFLGATPLCELCHQDDLARATSPDHRASGWVVGCDRCHIPSRWGGSGFRHAFFPLSGAHASLSCDACHPGGRFSGTPRDCFSCHAPEYRNAPDHANFGYPTNCELCHSTSTWSGAVLRHRFPLTGNHNVRCSECHTGGGTSAFTCFNCHEHNRTDTDADHDEVRGYSYDSQACFNCHPDGNN